MGIRTADTNNTHVQLCCPCDCDVCSEHKQKKIHLLCQSRKNSNREVHARKNMRLKFFYALHAWQLAMRCFEDWNLLFGLPCFPCGVTVWCVQNWHFTHLIYELVNTIKIQNLLDCFMSSRYLCAPPFVCHSIRESRHTRKKNWELNTKIKQKEMDMCCHFICSSVVCLCVYFAQAASNRFGERKEIRKSWSGFWFRYCSCDAVCSHRATERTGQQAHRASIK